MGDGNLDVRGSIRLSEARGPLLAAKMSNAESVAPTVREAPLSKRGARTPQRKGWSPQTASNVIARIAALEGRSLRSIANGRGRIRTGRNIAAPARFISGESPRP